MVPRGPVLVRHFKGLVAIVRVPSHCAPGSETNGLMRIMVDESL
jgi:hypothetical protein